MSISKRIKALRKKEGLTQQKFAERLGVKASYISRLESGSSNPSEQLLLSIANTFSVRLSWLKEGEGETYAQSYTYASDNPLLQAVIKKISQAQVPLSLGDIATVSGIDKKDPSRTLDLPQAYYDLICWMNRSFLEKDTKRIKAFMALMEALQPSEEEMMKRIEEGFKTEQQKKDKSS